MKTYITALQVQAEPAELDGDNGYWITFSDGWMTEKLWMPEDQFQAHFFPLEKVNSISNGDVVTFYGQGKESISTINQKTTLLHAVLPSGFEEVEASSCVDPANYNVAIGAQICTDRIKNRLWSHLGFMLQWARNGLTWSNLSSS